MDNSMVFLRSGNTFSVTSEVALDMHKKLPPALYVVRLNQQKGFYLETANELIIPTKLYGTIEGMAKRILSTFVDRPNIGTGVLLEGSKGSGKTLLSKLLMLKAIQSGVPAILINSPFSGDAFNEFLSSIKQSCVVIFDEFEKVYRENEQQDQLLTLLDGVFAGHKLYVLTSNDRVRINIHMQNRPGRLFYALSFTGVGQEFIKEYCADRLKYPEYTESICVLALLFDQFNFDMLQALVEEINRYGEAPAKALEFLNVKPNYGDQGRFEVELILADGTVIEKKILCRNGVYNGNPLSKTGPSVSWEIADEYRSVDFTPNHLKKLDPKEGVYIFVDTVGNKATFKRLPDEVGASQRYLYAL